MVFGQHQEAKTISSGIANEIMYENKHRLLSGQHEIK